MNSRRLLTVGISVFVSSIFAKRLSTVGSSRFASSLLESASFERISSTDGISHSFLESDAKSSSTVGIVLALFSQSSVFFLLFSLFLQETVVVLIFLRSESSFKSPSVSIEEKIPSILRISSFFSSS